MKKVFIFVLIIAIIGTISLYESGMVDKAKAKITETATSTAYAVRAEALYSTFINECDAQAAATADTGVYSTTIDVNGTEIEYSACYVNGNRVSVEDYQEYMLATITAQEAEITVLTEQNEELGTFHGFVQHLLSK